MVDKHTKLAHSSASHSTALHHSSCRSLKRAKFDFTSSLAQVQFGLILGLNVHRISISLVVINQFHSIDLQFNFIHIKCSRLGDQNFIKVATNRTIIIQYC